LKNLLLIQLKVFQPLATLWLPALLELLLEQWLVLQPLGQELVFSWLVFLLLLF
jgi:hypothetical protein